MRVSRECFENLLPRTGRQRSTIDLEVRLLNLYNACAMTSRQTYRKHSIDSPYCANGNGSTPLLVNLSATEAKHLNAPSATCESSCLSSVLNAWTQVGSWASAGSILVHNLETTAMAECNVSLCTRLPLSLMKGRMQLRPPASKTAPASRVHISSNTWRKGRCFTAIFRSKNRTYLYALFGEVLACPGGQFRDYQTVADRPDGAVHGYDSPGAFCGYV